MKYTYLHMYVLHLSLCVRNIYMYHTYMYEDVINDMYQYNCDIRTQLCYTYTCSDINNTYLSGTVVCTYVTSGSLHLMVRPHDPPSHTYVYIQSTISHQQLTI